MPPSTTSAAASWRRCRSGPDTPRSSGRRCLPTRSTEWWPSGRRPAAVAGEVCGALIRIPTGRLLGDFQGILGTDRFAAYNYGPPQRRRQFCWAHLIRDLQGMIDRDQGARKLGEQLLDAARQLFRLWRRFRDRTLTWTGFRRRLKALHLRESFFRLPMSGRWGGDRATRGLCHRLMNAFANLWTFTEIPGVEPTNNDAERELRHAVIYRMGCFGTWSKAGSRFVERMLTAVATLRKQGRSVLDYLARACNAHFAGRISPSLLHA